ncbi:MAG: universal stress protein, partial [Xenococcaceae cyanobacterium MO_207.B15]|nr:universal stress protein [Xenococcaceae cyanobacterium MO_207.B15]
MTRLKKKSVLIPLDFSELSYQAIATAKEYVDSCSSLSVIHVLTPLHPADPATLWHTLDDEEREHKVQEFLQTKLSEMGYEGVQIKVTIGNPSTKIVDYAEEIEADLIVMPSHGRKGMSRFLI